MSISPKRTAAKVIFLSRLKNVTKNIFQFLIATACLLIPLDTLSAQWVQTNGASETVVTCFAVAGTNLYAGTTSGVFLSTNNGATWSAVNTGLKNTVISALASSGTNIFAGTTGGVFLSTDNGLSWSAVDSGLTNTSIRALAVSGENLFAGTPGGVFSSATNGSSWSVTKETNSVNALAVSGTLIIAALNGSIASTSDCGAIWGPMDTGMSQHVGVFTVSGNDLFAGTPAGVYRTKIDAANWTSVGTGLSNTSVVAVAVSGTNLFAGSYTGVYIYTGNSTSWTSANTQLPKIAVTSLIVYGKNLFAGTNGGGIWKRAVSEMATSVEGQTAARPTAFGLYQNFPNPFNPTTTITFSLRSRSFVSVKVFDVMGSEVATVVDDELPAGIHSRHWEASGYPSGIYFYRMQAGSYSETKRLLILK
jgi:hypothetical protein